MDQTVRALSFGNFGATEPNLNSADSPGRIEFGGETFRVLASGLASGETAPVAVVLLDDAAPDRLEAIARFWRAQRGRPAPDPRVTPQRRKRLAQMLRAVDARGEQASYRAIAAVLFPHHRIEAASWAGDAIRETTIRLARDGRKLVDGGYRDLLRRPRKS
jgi:hypothetical protein